MSSNGYTFRQPGHRTFMMKYYRDGRPIVATTGKKTEREADAVLRQTVTDMERGAPLVPKAGRLRFDEGAADLVTDYTINKRDSVDELQRRIDKHLRPFFGGRRLATITAADVRAYVAHRLTQLIVTKNGARPPRPPANAEINRELATLKRIFTLAIEGGKLLYRPHIKLLREANARTGFFERAQCEAVCRHLTPELADVVRFAYVTGWRVASEILPLEWPQVNFSEKLTPTQAIPGTVRLEVGTTKNDEGRVFPFTRELKAVLDRRRVVADRLKKAGQIEPRIFVRMVAKGRGGPKRSRPIVRFEKAFRVACRAAGCPGKLLHDFRRTACRNLVRAGVSERVAMRLTGHKTRSVFERYNIVSDGDLGTAASRLDAASGRPHRYDARV